MATQPDSLPPPPFPDRKPKPRKPAPPPPPPPVLYLLRAKGERASIFEDAQEALCIYAEDNLHFAPPFALYLDDIKTAPGAREGRACVLKALRAGSPLVMRALSDLFVTVDEAAAEISRSLGGVYISNYETGGRRLVGAKAPGVRGLFIHKDNAAGLALSAVAEVSVAARAAVPLLGNRSGRLPYGWRWDGSAAVVDEQEAATLALIVKERDAGARWVDILRLLNEKGLKRRNGKPWAHSSDLSTKYERAKLAGGEVGRAIPKMGPWGFRRLGGRLIPKPDELEFTLRVIDLRAEGLKWADVLERVSGSVNRKGRAWTARGLSHIVKNYYTHQDLLESYSLGSFPTLDG